MIEVLEYTKNPLNTIGVAAGACWNSSREDVDKNIKRAIECIENNHGRVLEYVDVTLIISERSARVIREWYTHKIGTTNVHESTRYVNCKNFEYFTPNKIKNNEEAKKIYDNVMKNIAESYQQLLDLKIPREDVANILPLGMNTKIVTKINLRALIHMFEIRTCTRAYHEYRDLMKELKDTLATLDGEWKYICDNFLKTKCEKTGCCDEKYTCGRFPQKEK